MQAAPVRYFCPRCNTLLKETEVPVDYVVSTLVEECPACGSSLQDNLRKELASSQSPQAPPKFHTAYDFAAKLTFDIEQVDRLLTLSLGDRLCIVGGGRYANLLITRLWVRILMPHRHGGLEADSVVSVDAGNCTDVYQCVKFARQYYMDVRQVLRSIRVSRAFTAYQVAGLIIQTLHRVIERFSPKVVTVFDLLGMFDDPQVEPDEAVYLINEMVAAIRKIPDDILVVVSLHNSKSKPNQYDSLILPAFTKRIEISSSHSRNLKARMYSRQRLLGEASISDADLRLIPSVT